MKLSICIPTHNRPESLRNCLSSIQQNNITSYLDYEICVSDNSDNNLSGLIVSEFKNSLPLLYKKRCSKTTRANNYLYAVEMARGNFVWMIGDDDLLMTNAINEVINLINQFAKNIDFFYVNSYLLDTNYIKSYKQPFDMKNLPDKMNIFSKKNISFETDFLNLLDPEISFDYLGGMYLSIFRREYWNKHKNCLNKIAKNDCHTFSHYDNTFPHVKIFANAFSKSKAYFYHKPLSIALSGQREWSDLYPLVRSIRLLESITVFRENGLTLYKYMRYKNFSLKYFAQDIFKMILNKKNSGFAYVSFFKHIFPNLIYPNIYLSFFFGIARKLRIQIKFNNE